MAAIEELIRSIADTRLRDALAAAVAHLKAAKKFGLVFEEHLPETVLLPGLAIKVGARVMLKDDPHNLAFRVIEEVNGKRVKVIPDHMTKSGVIRGLPESIVNSAMVMNRADLVVAKAFGEPMYPALIPVDSVERAPGKPWHVLINADNYHALQLLQYGYTGKVDVIYIDPPYNTGARDWKYNNHYVDDNDQWRHSKWLSMIKKRLKLAKPLLKSDGVMIITIDDNEMNALGLLLDELFPEYIKHQITIVINPGGTYRLNFARVHEYAYFVCPTDRETITPIPVVQEELAPDEREEDDGFEYWKLRRTGAESAHRHQRSKQFYAIYVDEETMKAVRVGPELAPDESFSTRRADGLLPVYPIDAEGTHRVWRYGRETMSERIAEGAIIARRNPAGGLSLYFRTPKKNTKRHKTVWQEGGHSSVGTASTVLVDELIGRPGAFPFPKSVYAVRDCIAAVCRSRKDAIVLDFFGGSGTTLHATAMLNKEDGGNRRALVVSYNEVTENTEKRLLSQGLEPGTAKWEAQGICESATWPRCRAALTGKRADGTSPAGKYADGTLLSSGFKENAAYFKLDFLDPDEVSRGEQFEAVIPILWMLAGSVGACSLSKGTGKWFVPSGNRFAVLLKEDCFGGFREELAKRDDITHVFLVTDSAEAFNDMTAELGADYTCLQLYRSYIDTFRINLGEPGTRGASDIELVPAFFEGGA
jgi:adenine-specific DNA-methyltransferase